MTSFNGNAIVREIRRAYYLAFRYIIYISSNGDVEIHYKDNLEKIDVIISFA